MAEIYTLPTGLQVYDDRGATYNAKTGQLISGEPTPFDPFAPVSGSAGQAEKLSEPTIMSTAGADRTMQEEVIPKIKTANDLISQPKQEKEQQTVDELFPSELQDIEGLTPEERDAYIQEQAIQRYDKRFGDIYDGLVASNEAQNKAFLDQLKQQYTEARQQLVLQNKTTQAVYEQFGLRTGQARYAPTINQDMLDQKQQQGAAKLQELDNRYLSAVAEANAALSNKNYLLAFDKAEEIGRIEGEIRSNINEQIAEAQGIQQTLQEERARVTRENAISDLVAQGIEDPATIQNFLNFDEEGDLVGDVSLEEIQDVLEIINPPEEYTGLTADFKTFKQFFPETDITTEEGRKEYLNWQKAVANANRTSSSTGGGFTSQENRKLEQAGLLNAPRQQQLDFLYGGDTGQGNEFDDAVAYVNSLPDASDEQLKAALLRDSELSVSQINAIIAARERDTTPPTAQEVQQKIEETLRAVSDTYTRDEARDTAVNQLKSSLGLSSSQDLPQSYEDAIEDALVNVYGQTFWQSVIPGGR